MKIDFILSDTTNSASSAAIGEIIKKSQSDLLSNVLVLVPEPKSIAIERELLDKSENGAFANIFIYSFVRLLSRIGGIEEQNMVSKQTCVMLLRKIILDNANRLVCYQKTAKTIGFAEKMYETIEQFKSSSLTAQDVQNLAKNSEGALKSKMTDIALLFEEFESALGDGLFDDCDRLRKLGELAKSSEFIKNADIFVVGFDNVTSDMLEVLKEFATNAKSITFSCVYFNEKRRDKYIQDNELFRKFTSIAEKLKYPYNPKFVNSNYSGDFWNIQNYLYSTENKAVKSNGSVAVFELDNKQREFDWLANQILSEIKQGKRYRDIAVIDADFEKDIESISKVFDDYNIPYFITKSYDISSHFFVKFIKNSIEVITSRFSADKVLKWLASPILNIDCYGEFVNFVKEFGINWSSFLTEASNKQIKDEAMLDKVNAVLRFLKQFSDKFSLKFIGQKKIEEFVANVQELASFASAEEKLLKISEEEKQSGLEIESEVTGAVFEKFKKLNENLVSFLGDKEVSILEFLQIYLSGFAEEEVNLVPVSVDSVFIQKKADGLYKIKDLFIIGAVEGNFPVKMADTGILQDRELEESGEIVQKKIEPEIKDINKREKFAQFELMLLPSEKLFVSYPVRSFGATNKPASSVSRLCKLFGIEPQKSYFNNENITQKIAEKQFAKLVGEYLSGEMISMSKVNEEYNKLKNTFSPNFSDFISSMCFGEKEFKISSAKEIYFVNNKTSVSQLERYFSCPYSFFARYGLRLKDNKDASLNSLDIGTIVHKFAELFTKNIEKFVGLEDKEFDEKAKQILASALNELEINTQKNTAVINFVFGEVVRLAHYLFLEQEKSSFKNDHKLNEFEFSGNNAVKIQVDENTVISIEGKIDRVDKFGDYIRIIDYKTGETDSNLGAIYYGKKIQLVSYLSAAEKLGNTKVAGLFYFPIHSDFVKIDQKLKNNYKMQGFLLDNIDVVKYMDCTLSVDNNESEFVPIKIKNNKEVRETGEFQISYGRTKVFLSEKEFDDLKMYTNQLCKVAIGEILDGNIEPSPIAKAKERESQECSFCELNGFCGKEHARLGMARRCGGTVQSESFDLNKGDEDGDRMDWWAKSYFW